jgi:outer membrane receptor for monomeric catechols
MKRGFSVDFGACKKKGTKRIHPFISLPVILALNLTAVLAQDNAATISGVVTDPNGTVVVGAQVTSTHTQSRQARRTVTDSQGGYTFSNLAPGLYRIEVVAKGFAVSAKEASVAPGATATADFRLAIGTVAESVTTRGQSYEVTIAATGTKTDTPILAIPQSIQVVPQQVIEDQKPLTLSGILRNVSGFSQKNVPRHSARVWGKYEIAIGDESRFGFGAGFTYTDDLPGDLGNTFVVPGYTVLDAMAFFKYKQVTMQVNVYNLFDNEYFHRAAFGSQGIIPGEPLRAVASLGYRF